LRWSFKIKKQRRLFLQDGYVRFKNLNERRS
jgi:hypothetical protein